MEKRPQKWKTGWLLNQDNVPCHMSLSIQQFLAAKSIPVMRLPYSPELAPCDFWLFPKLERTMKGKRFDMIRHQIQHVRPPEGD